MVWFSRWDHMMHSALFSWLISSVLTWTVSPSNNNSQYIMAVLYLEIQTVRIIHFTINQLELS